MNRFTQTYTPDDLARARSDGNVIASAAQPDGVAFTYWVEDPAGADFGIFREPHHTASNILQAKRWLVLNRDVLSMLIYLPETPAVIAEEQPSGCPFCGGTAILRHPPGQPVPGEHQVACQDCGAQTRFFDTKPAAVRAWNRRAN